MELDEQPVIITNANSTREGIKMKYIVIDSRRDGTGDWFSVEFDSLFDAMAEADWQWDRLTNNEKKQRTIRVLESANRDEEADDHFDGEDKWVDGLYIHAEVII